MNRELVLIHTVPPLVDVFNRLCAELLPGVRIMHILDEPLLERVSQRGRLATDDVARMVEHVAVAEQVGAGAVLVTCSTVSPCVDGVRPQAHIPVLKIDELMIAEAVALGTRIGVVATNATTLAPTRSLLEAQAQRVGKQIAVELVLVEGALPALLSGDGAAHDRLVRQAVLELGARCDIVILAQASIARVLAVIPEAERSVPVLSSPHLALVQIKTLLED
jgi:Asp/Glu/hydantoin racemase